MYLYVYLSVDHGAVLYHNRFFIALRGNEIQNDMWDYDPGCVDTDEKVKEKAYQGGYWYKDTKYGPGNVKSRYLHINCLKTCLDDDTRR